MLKFKEEFKDILDVSRIECFCFGAGGEMTPERLKAAGGGSKFSKLCGFKFYSKVNPKYRNGEFMLVFCAKLRSKIYRQATQNPSQWFAFLRTGKGVVEVLDKQFCMLAFDFDVDKFFDTDLFAAACRKFENVVKNGVAKAENMISRLSKKDAEGEDIYDYLPRYIKAIKEAIPLIGRKRFNDLKYTLKKTLEDPKVKDQKKGNFDVGKFADFVRKDQEKAELKKTMGDLDRNEPAEPERSSPPKPHSDDDYDNYNDEDDGEDEPDDEYS